jgi:hypothetical protein
MRLNGVVVAVRTRVNPASRSTAPDRAHWHWQR